MFAECGGSGATGWLSRYGSFRFPYSSSQCGPGAAVSDTETRWTRVDLQAFTEPKDAKDAGVPCSHPGGPALVELGEVVQVCGVLDDKVHLEADGWTAV